MYNNRGGMDIQILLNQGILTQFQYSQLKRYGFVSIGDVVFKTAANLAKIPGISLQEATRLIQVASSYVETGWIGAQQAYQRSCLSFSISTGSQWLDSLVGKDGLEQGTLVMLGGGPGTGKSNLLFHLCVTAQNPVWGGGAGAGVLFIDVAGTFRSQRIIQIARRYGIEPSTALSNILVSRCHSLPHLHFLLVEAKKLMLQKRFGLLLIDNITTLFRMEFDNSQVFERQQALASILQWLRLLMEEFPILIVYSVEVYANIYANQANEEQTLWGGSITQFYSHTILRLAKEWGELRRCDLLKSNSKPCRSAYFVIREDGIRDI